MSNTDWLSIEKLVHLIEKSLAPGSTVEHNVKLPDLTSDSKNKRQCDIVIKSGEPHRQTITIVEVQSRKSKFNITFFQGLIDKMRDVGAQHLICVSTTGFTKSIQEKARKLGGTVRLVELKKDNSLALPLFRNFKFIDSRPIYNLLSDPIVNYETPLDSENPISLNLDDKVFTISSNPSYPHSAKDLIELYFRNNSPTSDGNYIVKFPDHNNILTINNNGQTLNVVQFECLMSVVVRENEISTNNVYSYTQEASGPLAWVLEGVSTMENLTNIFRLTIKPGEGENFLITALEITQTK